MKVTAAATVSLMAAIASAMPTDINYDAPKGGWESIDYPAGTGENLDSYPPPPGGWESVSYPAGTGSDASTCEGKSSFPFTSYYEIHATPDQVVNGTTPTGGLPGATGLYKFSLHSPSNTLCYDITLYAFKGDYQSPALSATHIHEAARGASGPPRIAFPNPVEVSEGVRKSVGCLTGPFKTGVMAEGKDSGDGFEVKRIEEMPGAFFADVHSSLAVPGAVRGQIA